MIILTLVKKFLVKLGILLRCRDMRNVEGFMGGLLVLWGLYWFFPVGVIGINSRQAQDFARLAPIEVWAISMIGIGAMQIAGAVYDVYAWRRNATIAAIFLWWAMTPVYWLSHYPTSGRVLVPYFALAEMWLFVRMRLDRRSITKQSTQEADRHGDGFGSSDSRDNSRRVWYGRRNSDQNDGRKIGAV